MTSLNDLVPWLILAGTLALIGVATGTFFASYSLNLTSRARRLVDLGGRHPRMRDLVDLTDSQRFASRNKAVRPSLAVVSLPAVGILSLLGLIAITPGDWAVALSYFLSFIAAILLAQYALRRRILNSILTDDALRALAMCRGFSELSAREESAARACVTLDVQPVMTGVGLTFPSLFSVILSFRVLAYPWGYLSGSICALSLVTVLIAGFYHAVISKRVADNKLFHAFKFGVPPLRLFLDVVLRNGALLSDEELVGIGEVAELKGAEDRVLEVRWNQIEVAGVRDKPIALWRS